MRKTFCALNTNKIQRWGSRIALALTLGLVTLLSSCTYGANGIFYSLEHVTKIANGNGFGSNSKYISINSVVEYPVSGTSYYLATGGADLFWEKPGSDLWQNVGTLPGVHVASVGELPGVGNSNAPSGATPTLYAVSGDDNGNSALYYTQGDFHTGTWQKISFPAGLTPVNLVPVLDSNAHFPVAYLVNTQNSTLDYQNVFLLTPSNPTTLTQPSPTQGYSLVTNNATRFYDTNMNESSPTLGSPVIAASVDGASLTSATTMYVLNTGFLWTASLSGGSFTSSAPFYLVSGLPGGNGPYGAMAYIAAPEAGLTTSGVLLGSSDNSLNGGNLWQGTVAGTGTAGATWTTVNQLASNARNSYSYIFDFNTIAYKNTNTLFIGSVRSGMGQIYGGTFAGPPNSNTVDTNSWASSLLEQYGVQSFFLGSDGEYFLGTYGFGLWVQASDNTFSLQ